jgi:hypothetical protein
MRTGNGITATAGQQYHDEKCGQGCWNKQLAQGSWYGTAGTGKQGQDSGDSTFRIGKKGQDGQNMT